jgi:predicted Zn-dependent protease with MMP-like domain
MERAVSEKQVDDLLEQGLATLDGGDPKRALGILERACELDPDDADVRHALALCHEDLDDFDAMKREFLQVRLLDAASDRSQRIGTPRQLRFIEEIALDVLARLPEPFKGRLAAIPVVLEPRPSLHLVHDGFDPRAFGLFEGNNVLDDGVAEQPARIVVFTHNLLAEYVEEDALAEQIEITLLHEIGHYFGLEEDDMDRLDLA